VAKNKSWLVILSESVNFKTGFAISISGQTASEQLLESFFLQATPSNKIRTIIIDLVFILFFEVDIKFLKNVALIVLLCRFFYLNVYKNIFIHLLNSFFSPYFYTGFS
jgi:hypothetical protein